MHILETDWFLRLVQKSANSPQGKLIGIFDVLKDWLEAPQIGEQILSIHMPTQPPIPLFNFLVTEAKACGAALPEALAHQLYFILISSLRDFVHHPYCLSIARETAQALIQAQSHEIKTAKLKQYGRFNKYAMASLALLGLMTAVIATGVLFQPARLSAAKAAEPTIPNHVTDNPPITILPMMSHDASPRQTSDMLAKIEQMRKGTCIFPEVLMLPQKQRDVYLQSVVHGEIPSSIEDQQLMNELMEKVHCNYTPMLMQNSIG